MQRIPLIAGNWKMHTSLAEARNLAAAVVSVCKGLTDREVMIAPPFTALATVAEVVRGSGVRLAAQNICWEEQGAFTGEIAPGMLRELGCDMAIIGHSERRHIFGESDALVNQRMAGAMRFGITPILCFGETLAEREGGQTMAVLERQIRAGLADIAVVVIDINEGFMPQTIESIEILKAYKTPFVIAANYANKLGLGLNAGHDLSLINLKYFNNKIPNLLEVSIGHALICDALYYGLEKTIKMYLGEL